MPTRVAVQVSGGRLPRLCSHTPLVLHAVERGLGGSRCMILGKANDSPSTRLLRFTTKAADVWEYLDEELDEQPEPQPTVGIPLETTATRRCPAPEREGPRHKAQECRGHSCASAVSVNALRPTSTIELDLSMPRSQPTHGTRWKTTLRDWATRGDAMSFRTDWKPTGLLCTLNVAALDLSLEEFFHQTGRACSVSSTDKPSEHRVFVSTQAACSPHFRPFTNPPSRPQ